MLKKILHNKNLSKEILILSLLYVSLLISFLLGENSTGGTSIDYEINKKIREAFSLNFYDKFFNYTDNYTSRHSPVLNIILSFFEKFNFPDLSIRLLHLHFCLFLPFFFYKCIEVKFKNVDKNVFYFLTFLIFLSPTFRSLAIWPDSRISGLIFFTIGTFFYLKFVNEKKFNFVILNTFFIALSAYFSPNFSVFSIYFIINFISHYKFNSKEIYKVLLLNLLLSLPALYYIFFIEINFFSHAAITAEPSEKIFFNNIFNDILITFTLVFFYILPFIVTKIINIQNPFKIRNIILSFLIFILCFFNFDYDLTNTGGGIFFQFSNIFFNNNYFFYFIGFVSILICSSFLINSNFNILIFLLIILNNPQITIYHKYFDPFLLILFFTIFDLRLQINKIMTKKNYLIVFFYFLSFLIISNFKYLWKI